MERIIELVAGIANRLIAYEYEASACVLHFRYRNHRGEVTDREVLPERIYLGTCEWHAGEQWLMDGVDTGKGAAHRTFAIADIIQFIDEPLK